MFVCDVTVRFPSTQSLPTASRVEGAAATEGYISKMSDYGSVWSLSEAQLERTVVPIVFETTGRMHPRSKEFIQNILQRAYMEEPISGRGGRKLDVKGYAWKVRDTLEKLSLAVLRHTASRIAVLQGEVDRANGRERAERAQPSADVHSFEV